MLVSCQGQREELGISLQGLMQVSYLVLCGRNAMFTEQTSGIFKAEAGERVGGMNSPGHAPGEEHELEGRAKCSVDGEDEGIEERCVGDQMVVIQAQEIGLSLHDVQYRLQHHRGRRSAIGLQGLPEFGMARPGQEGGQFPDQVFDAFAGAEGVPEDLGGGDGLLLDEPCRQRCLADAGHAGDDGKVGLRQCLLVNGQFPSSPDKVIRGGDGLWARRGQENGACLGRLNWRYGQQLIQEVLIGGVVGAFQEKRKPVPVEIGTIECRGLEQHFSQRLFILFVNGQTAAIKPLIEGVCADRDFIREVNAYARHGHAPVVGDHFHRFVQVAAEFSG